jgi:hypothetical protein
MEVVNKIYKLIDPPSVVEDADWIPAAAHAGESQDGVERLKSVLLDDVPKHTLRFLAARDLRSLNLVSKQMSALLSDPVCTQRICSGVYCRFQLFPHQYSSLLHMARAETRDTRFGALRGGILGDSPGLGKTVTMMASIVNTTGALPHCPHEFYNRDEVSRAWASYNEDSEEVRVYM